MPQPSKRASWPLSLNVVSPVLAYFIFGPYKTPSQRPLVFTFLFPGLVLSYSLPSLLSLFCSVPRVFLSSLAYIMAQIRGTAGYNLGHQSPFGNVPGRQDATSDPSPLETIREQTSKIEDWLDTVSDPIKP